MRTVYGTSLEIRDAADAATATDHVIKWVHDWYRRKRLSPELPDKLPGGDLDLVPFEGHRIVVRRYSVKDAVQDRLADIWWSYPDQYDDSLAWAVRVALLIRPQSLLLSIDVAVSGIQMLFAPARIKLGSPRVIRDICRLRSVSIAGYSYNVSPDLVSAQEVEMLVGRLTDKGRPYPIVLISRRLQDDAPLIDVTGLAARLAGVAKVCELTDKWSAYRLTEELSKPFSCFGGAVRLYWPRFTHEADPFEHPVWMPWQFRDSEVMERSLGQLCGMVFDAAAFRHIEPAAITSVRQLAEREAREALRVGKKKTADELLDDLISMEERLNAYQETNAELLRENETLRSNATALAAHARWSAAPEAKDPSPSEDAHELAAPKSVADAVEVAELRAKSTRFLPSAHSSAQDSPYRHPERVLQALTAVEEVAALWAETIDSGKSAGSIKDLFKKRGFDFSDSISQTSRGKWGDEYIAEYNGQNLSIAPHITIGAKQADSCLSIHWAWFKADKVAVVAHVGRHKTNTRT